MWLTALIMCWPASGSESGGDYLTDCWTCDDGLPHSSVTALAQTPDGYLWVGTHNGLARFGSTLATAP